MLKKKAACHAISTDGFEVTFKGRDDLIYIEHLAGGKHRKVTVYAGMLVGGRVHISIEAGPRWLTRWDSPDDGESIAEEERKQIVHNITDALDFLGISYFLTQ